MQEYQLTLLGDEQELGSSFIELLEQASLSFSKLQQVVEQLDDEPVVDEDFEDDFDEDQSSRSVLQWQGSIVERILGDELDWAQPQVLVLLQNNQQLRELAEQAAQHGYWVIDLHVSEDSEHGLSDASVNADGLAEASFHKWLNCPRPSASVVARLVAALQHQVSLTGISVTALLSANTQGKAGVDELAGQAARLLNGLPVEHEVYGGQLAFNVLPRLGSNELQQQLTYEQALSKQVQALSQVYELKTSFTCVQVPVFYGDTYLVELRSAYPMYAEEVVAGLADIEGFVLEEEALVNPVDHGKESQAITVSQISQDPSDDCSVKLVLVTDSVKIGLLSNAVNLLEQLQQQYL